MGNGGLARNSNMGFYVFRAYSWCFTLGPKKSVQKLLMFFEKLEANFFSAP